MGGWVDVKAVSRITYNNKNSLHSWINDGEHVAVKFLPTHRAVEKLRPRQEIEILSDLNHQNILRLIGAYEASDLFIQVFEFLRHKNNANQFFLMDCYELRLAVPQGWPKIEPISLGGQL